MTIEEMRKFLLSRATGLDDPILKVADKLRDQEASLIAAEHVLRCYEMDGPIAFKTALKAYRADILNHKGTWNDLQNQRT